MLVVGLLQMESRWMSIRSLALFFLLTTLLLGLFHSGVTGYPTDVDTGALYAASLNEESSSEESVESAEDLPSSLFGSRGLQRAIHGRHHVSKRSDSCHAQSLDKKILCERCAKYTKSHTVYTMCCDNVDDKVRLWCKNFLEYEFGVRN